VSNRSVETMIAIGFALSMVSLGCGGGREDTPQARATEPPSVATDPAAERQFIRLTGCVKPDATPGQFVLTSVATAGTVDEPAAKDEKPRSWAAEEKSTTQGQGTAIAGSTYQLIAPENEEPEDFAAYQNKRVTVKGRLAPDTPVGTTGKSAEPGRGTTRTDKAGTEVQRDATGSKVTADAPPARGLYVESITKVSDTCGGE
jgi:hypothetical protein